MSFVAYLRGLTPDWLADAKVWRTEVLAMISASTGAAQSKIRYQQLFLADLQRPRMRGPKAGRQGRRARRPRPQPPQPLPPAGWVQLKLPIEIRRDFTRFDRRRHADLANPWLIRARAIAQAIGEARGWSRWAAREVDQGLVILLSDHVDGDKIRYSELFPGPSDW